MTRPVAWEMHQWPRLASSQHDLDQALAWSGRREGHRSNAEASYVANVIADSNGVEKTVTIPTLASSRLPGRCSEWSHRTRTLPLARPPGLWQG